MADDTTEERLALLRSGTIEVKGRMPWSSNGTFLVELCAAERAGRGVYKPHRGERPLWDFPDGLFRREVAAYELSEALGWELVPPTVERDGPIGAGSLQWFVDADFEQHYYTLLEDETHHPALMRLCVFDILANSTDRKGGHVLVDADEHLWAIDNGLTFHAEFKLRTVIWEFAGQRIPDDVLDAVAALIDQGVPEAVTACLDPFEREALRTRARAVLDGRRFPTDPSGRRYPWPLI